MSRGNFFWGSILTVAGVILLLNNLGLLAVDVWGILWPAFLIALGIAFLWGALTRSASSAVEETAIPLEGASEARVRLRHGAGRLSVQSGAQPEELASGSFVGGLACRSRRRDNRLEVEMEPSTRSFPDTVMPWNWGGRHTLDWSVHLNGEIPLTLDFETGANDARLDLSSLRVTDLRLQTGASSTDVTMPTSGHTRAEIKSGAASVRIQVPSDVAARIETQGALSDINVDQSRFPRAGNVYQSSDYETAENKVDLRIETGVGSVQVR